MGRTSCQAVECCAASLYVVARAPCGAGVVFSCVSTGASKVIAMLGLVAERERDSYGPPFGSFCAPAPCWHFRSHYKELIVMVVSYIGLAPREPIVLTSRSWSTTTRLPH
jgi:hypothetical protein